MATSVRRRVRLLGRGSASRQPAEGVGALFDEFAPMVLAVCRYNLRDRQAAEDAAQETFLNAHRSLLAGTEPRDPAAWLATIARNECRRTALSAQAMPLDEETTGTVLDTADVVADRADLSDVANAIAELPDRQREALVLREFCGLSYEQVAAAMSVSGGAVDSLLSRARKRLIEQLGDIPRAARGTIVVPASFREELSRLIPGLDPAGAAAAGAGGAAGAATLAGLGSAPVTAKIAATGAAAVVLALPVQATVRTDAGHRAETRSQVASAARPAADLASASTAPAVRPVAAAAPSTRSTRPRPTPARRTADSSGPGPGTRNSDSSGPGSGSDEAGSSGSGSSDLPSTGSSDSSGSGSGSSGSGSSGSGSSGSGSTVSGSTSSGSSGSSGSGSSTPDSSGSGSGVSGSSGSGSSGSSGSGSSTSDSSGSGSTASGSSGSGSSGSGSSGSGGSGSGSDDD